MAIIQWNESLSVDIAEIDTQHQRLIRMINDLNDAMRQGKGKEVLGKIITGLITYTRTHFKAEEDYFAQFGYPDAATHKQEHVRFVEKVASFKQEFEQGKLGLSLEIMSYLSDWLQGHIKGVDKKYAPFFHSKGLK